MRSMEALARHPYTGHAVIMGKRKYPVQDSVSVLERFSSSVSKAKTEYERFVAARLEQGTRKELQGGGLIRSLSKLLLRGIDDREAADDRILGGGEFVESVLGQCEGAETTSGISVAEILAEVAERTGVSSDEIVGPTRAHAVSKARREFYLCAHERTGTTLAALAKLTRRTHVAVLLAMEEAKKDRAGRK